ncbi:MAG: hypothetical protein CVV41_07810 [Candidatus Riflebacteria bacterium HGW-Riflebacteria-1]|jgi:anti-anti-sigma factor|nr:MAG: hypothetical protein CVV41_07810 [Candidatus Riflebacteria bacterium HGW-Riflebacteria-1]
MSEFKLEKAFAGDVLILRPEGYFNEPAGQAVRAFIRASAAEKTKKVVLNLEKVAVINSQGITQMLELVEDVLYELKGKIVLVGVSQLYLEVFQVIGLTGMTSIFADEKTAIAQL